jgi:ADP-heptose:LPS heptosyltransferase
VRARPWRRAAPPARVLAIRLHALGDTVLTLPWLDALRRSLPGGTLDFLTREEVAGIPGSVVLFDRVHEIGGGRTPPRMLLEALRLVPRLRRRRYDVVVDLQRSRISRIFRRLLRPAAWSEFDRLSPRTAAERTRETIEAAGLGPLEIRPGLKLRDPGLGADVLSAAGWNGADPLVVLNPAGTFAARRWPLEAHARFAEHWLEREPGTRFLVLGLASLSPAAAVLRERLGGRLLDLTGRTRAAEAFAALARVEMVLTEDSGLMHMAAAAGAPTLALFGGSRVAWSAPQGPRSDWMRACERADGDCIDGRCRASRPTCLERLGPEAVLERAVALRERAHRG